MIFVTVDAKEQPVIDFFGISQDAFPTAFIVRLTDAGPQKYSHPDGTPSVASLKTFADDFLADKLEVYIKSEPVPENQGPGVQVIVGKNFQEIVMNSEKDVLVEFYAPWCGHCKQLEPIWNKLGEEYAEVETITIGKMDATANDPPPHINLQGFPTIILFPASNKLRHHTFEGGTRKLKDFRKFLKKKASLPFTPPKKKKK
mmetsp:Transcript_16559/g.39398  ORF Transcript_16559/g.39398 Transcript_16559/m.39398 type:complete len:201 (+) Transcript_16559:908-1510(+)